MSIEKFFAPDIICTFERGIYICVPETELGSLFIKKYKGVRMDKGCMIAASLFEDVYKWMLNIGLCVCRIDGDEE